MKTNYEGHEGAYQKFRSQSLRVGWDDSKQLAANIASLQAVLRWPTFPRSGRVMELGCGAGNICIELARLGFEVCGVDIAPTAIDWARQNSVCAGVAGEFSVGNVLELADFADASFDIVYDGHCLHCIIGEDRLRFFANARRLLRPGGTFLVRTMCNHVPKGVMERGSFDPATRCTMSASGYATRYIGWANDIIREVIDAGFDVVQLMVEPANAGIDEDIDELQLVARRPY
jgi:SAM-dependent methyltransferase